MSAGFAESFFVKVENLREKLQIFKKISERKNQGLRIHLFDDILGLNTAFLHISITAFIKIGYSAIMLILPLCTAFLIML